MPSLDTIRTVTIRGQTDGVDQATAALNKLTASIASANDNLSKSRAIAQDNREGFRLTGEGALSAANHLRQAAEAAYIFSPAFRGVVNEMRTPALAAAGTALQATAAGIVLATNAAGRGLITLAGATEKVAPQFGGLTASMRGAGVAMEAFAPSAATASASILGVAGAIATRLLPIVGQIVLVYDAIKLVGSAWTLAGQRLDDYNKMSSNSVGLSTEFFQRITKAAESAKTPISDLTDALKKMNEQLTPKLGGSEGLNRLDELKKAGNFSGNGGADQLGKATDAQERLTAMVRLLKEAGAASEQLAAIDLAKTIMGSGVATNLQKDYDYLDNIKRKADEIAGASIVSDADVGRAVQIQARFDAAYKTLSERWHPLQEILTDLGTRLKLEWLSFLEAVAGVATVFEKAYNWVARLAAVGFDNVKQGLRQAAGLQGSQFGPLDDSAGSATDRAMGALRSGLAQKSQIDNAVARTKALSDQLRPDRSKDPAVKPIVQDTSAFDRAEESLRKYTETSNAAAKSIDMTVDAQERLKAIAQLTAAGMKDGLTREAAAAKAELNGLARQAGDAALALERAKVASEIKFGANTSLLSQEDVQIASRLKGIYPDVATALGSVEAQGMRTNNALKGMASTIEGTLTTGLADIFDGTKKAGQGFADMGKIIARAFEEMAIKIAIVTPLMRALQYAASSFFSPAAATVGVDGLAAIHHTGGVVGDPAMPSRYISPAYFDDAPRFHSGGIVGDEVPIIAKRGEEVGWPDQLARKCGGGGAPQVNVNLIETAQGGGGVKQKPNANGGLDLEIAIAMITAKGAATPGAPLNRVLTDQLGSRQRLVTR